MGSRSLGAEDAEALVFANSVGEGEGMRVLPQDSSEGRLTKQVDFV